MLLWDLINELHISQEKVKFEFKVFLVIVILVCSALSRPTALGGLGVPGQADKQRD